MRNEQNKAAAGFFCHRIAVFGLALFATMAAQLAAACSDYQPFDPNRVLDRLSREQIAALPEVIVEGVVEPYDASKDAAEPKDSLGMTTMRIERVLKGDVEPTTLVLFSVQSMDCTHEPPFGQRIRFGASLLETPKVLERAGIPWELGGIELSTYRRALLKANGQVLDYRNFDIPLDDRALNDVLEQAQIETQALQKEASVGDAQAKLKYAAHLTENNETSRALSVYEALFRENPDDLDLLLTLAVARTRVGGKDEPEATLSEVEQRAPRTDEWNGKIVRTRFAATGRLTPGWKNWTELKPTQSPYCENRDMNLDGAAFDRSDLAGCDFQEASFRRGSFLGTDLSHAYFGYGPGPRVDMSGAKYDCVTKFPVDFDPAKEGMVNVEGSCAVQAPQ
jgi:hypothetical protein